MEVEKFVKILNAEFYTGVPDSQLKALCDYLMRHYGIDSHHHIIAANEGNCTALAAGYYMATGKIPVVYMQNSGEGNAINPIASLLNKQVYAIPIVFVIGWRGEPGIHDEPQHIYQGEITTRLLELMKVDYFIISKETLDSEVEMAMAGFREKLMQGQSVAFVIRKNALESSEKMVYQNLNKMNREEVIRHIVAISKEDPVISTTGKSSRELFEIRESNNTTHATDFLTVGSMGHCSSIALGIALNKPASTIWCIDGDGAALMHMGAIPVIADSQPQNLIHIVINNGSHETVGGQPTVMRKLNFWEIARDCGYPYSACVSDYASLDRELTAAKNRKKLTFIEVKCGLGARADLGRPTISAIKNKENFMNYLNERQ